MKKLVWGTVAAALLATWGCSSEPSSPGHTFEASEENGVTVVTSSAIPKFEGELFHYEKVLELRPDPDNFDESALYRPRSMTLGDDGLLYVADNGNHRIAVFDMDGNFVRAFGSEGQGPGEMQGPVWVDVNDGVARVRERRISRFRTDGTFIDLVTWEGGDGGVHLTNDGTKVVIDLPQGPEDDGFYYLQSRARVLDDSDEVVATVETSKVASSRIDDSTELGRAELEYSAWPMIFVWPGNRIISSPGNEPVLRWYDLEGNLLQEARIDLPPQPVTQNDIDAVNDRYDRLIEQGMRYGANEQFREMLLGMKAAVQYPETKAAWSRTHVEGPGNWIWLTIPVPDFGVYTRGSPRILQQQSFHIVSEEGEYIGTTSWPAEVSTFATNVVRGHLLAMVPDNENGEEIPTVYRITPAVEGLEYPGGR